MRPRQAAQLLGETWQDTWSSVLKIGGLSPANGDEDDFALHTSKPG
jgi:hypothetical protein